MFFSASWRWFVSRSSSPLALSVVTLTEPNSVDATFQRITEFDDRDFGFNHNQTWMALPLALRGELKASSVAASFSKTPKRIQRCITALCELGERSPLKTMRFADYPEAGLKSVKSIDWDPAVRVRVKATCWYVRGEQAVIPILQPRKAALDLERLAIYVHLARRAYCQGDWVNAAIQLIDLSGEDDSDVTARFVDLSVLPLLDDRLIREYVQTFVEAKKMADKKRADRPKKPAVVPMADILGI